MMPDQEEPARRAERAAEDEAAGAQESVLTKRARQEKHTELILANLTGLARGFLSGETGYLLDNEAALLLASHLLTSLRLAIRQDREEELVERWISLLPQFRQAAFELASARRVETPEGETRTLLTAADVEYLFQSICPGGPIYEESSSSARQAIARLSEEEYWRLTGGYGSRFRPEEYDE